MANIASLNIGLSANSAKLSKDLDKARKRTKKFGKGASKDFGGIGGSLKSVGALIGGLAIGSAIKSSIQDVRAFSKAASELSTLGFDDKEIKEFTGSARELATSFGSDSVGQVNAYYQAVSAGATSFAEAQKVIEGANKLALGGVTDITTATDGLTSVLNAYGLSADKVDEVSDTFFATMKAGKTTVGELSTSIGKVAPLASALGLSFKETGAAIAQVTKSGLSTSEAVTGLKAALANIIKPSKQATELADELGIAFDAQSLKAEGLVPFIQKVAAATGGSTTEMSKFFGSIEGVNSVLALSRGEGKGFEQTLKGIQNASGATAEAVDKVQSSLDFQLSKAGAELKELSLSLGEAFLPIINAVLPAITGAVSSLANAIKTFTSAASFTAAIESINFSGLGMKVGEAISNAVKFIFSTEGGSDIAMGLFNAVKVVFSGLGDFLIGVIKGAFSGIDFSSLLPDFGSLFEASSSKAKSSGGIFDFEGFAAGGSVSGPGSDTSDSILARLSDGEFVINAESAKNNMGLLNAINGGKGLPGFQTGGSVESAAFDQGFSAGFGDASFQANESFSAHSSAFSAAISSLLSVTSGGSSAPSADPYEEGYSQGLLDSEIDFKPFDGGIDDLLNWSTDPYLFNQGGVVPGSGSTDSVPALLTPGEIVLNKQQQESLLNGGMGMNTQVGSVNLNVSNDTDLDQLNEQMINKWGFGFAPRQGGLI